jgi:type II restriction/modification system DNA methylase subunit YeeA
MDKTAIKNFAIAARKKLREAIEQRVYALGITKSETKDIVIHEDRFEIYGDKFPIKILKLRESLITNISIKGYDQVIEEASYTWFNRFTAIRFMEVNEYLPSGIRVLSSAEGAIFEPDIISEALNLDLKLDSDLVYKLQDENKTEELYKYLLVKQCNELGKIMPLVFKELEDYMELLLPDNLLHEDSVIRDLITSITEKDWKEQVEIIGWLYQYYISEKKDLVFEELKKNIKISKENIPAATQLFTPDWIVKYMVENSLGRLWLETHPSAELKQKWKYYLEDAEQKPKEAAITPTDIKFFDPAMGSGHMLVYAFEVFYDIYKSAGYPERDIPKLILENNLYGLDIDGRAAQMAYFAVIMKARSYNRRIFREEINLNICPIAESKDFPREAIDFFADGNLTLKEQVTYILDVFQNAKELGSIVNVNIVDFQAIENRIEEIRASESIDIFQLKYKSIILDKLPAYIKQAKLMNLKYHVVCTNPPYMGKKGMTDKLSSYLDKNYPHSKSDLFAVFMEKGFDLLKDDGFNTMVTMQSWMFLPSFKEMRIRFIRESHIVCLLHMDIMVMGIAFGTSATVFRKRADLNYEGQYCYVSMEDLNKGIPKEFPVINNRYRKAASKVFLGIPDSPISYWVSPRFIDIFKESKLLGYMAVPRQGLATGDNNRFMRFWTEVDFNSIGFGCESREAAQKSLLKWFPYNKGGLFRKWYGNLEYVVDWERDGEEIRNFRDERGKTKSRPQNLDYYFKEGITWTLISSSGLLGVRYIPKGFIFDVNGMTLFAPKEKLLYMLCLMCSKVALSFLEIINSTMAFQVGDIKRIPVIFNHTYLEKINKLGEENIKISKDDWDSVETSWDFRTSPLITCRQGTNTIKEAYENWESIKKNQVETLIENEEELNRIFIDIYGLAEELSPKVEIQDITIKPADRERDIKAFISYAVGCMFGRYSLDEEGLIYAGGPFDKTRYKTINIASDNIIPITDEEYFEDDLVGRFTNFVKLAFSEETLEENLEFIAESLGRKGNETCRQTIRRYFVRDFYKDHLAVYQKKPIYWQFSSGKNDGFKALIYMHRYDIGSIARVRTEYLHVLQKKYEAEIARMDALMESSNITSIEKSEAKKKKEKLQKQLLECAQYDQVIAHAANKKIIIDLNDGVNINYGKFQEMEVPQGESKKPLKANLLTDLK